MKTLFSSKTLIALAVAVAAAAAYETEANEQPIPPPATESPLPDGIQPGSPVAQVVKLVQAGVDTSVIQTFISNCPSGFNLDADKIILLTDAGLPGDLMNAMFAHDKTLLASISTAASASPTASPSPQPDAAEPSFVTDDATSQIPQEVTINNFYDTLSPYGTWVSIDGYGYCWRPNLVIYDSAWRPYCDRGRWVYTDCGWYWSSDYAWGATFHYGRWFNSPHYGWCWWPDTVWAPSWVTWRSGNDYCGWAPLPPFTGYQPGIGFSYCGNHVAVNFGFGLGANSFTFISYGNFCQPQPRRFCIPQPQVAQIYGQTTIINNFDSNNHRRLQNNGISATVIGTARRHPVEAVPVSSLNHGRHHEWNGGNSHARIVGVVSTDNDATRNFAGAENHRNSQVQNIDVNNNHHPGASATAFRDTAPGHANPMASRPGQNQVAGAAPNAPTSTRRAQQNQNPSPVRDLILRGHPAQNPGTAINNYAAAQTPARSQARQPLTAGGVDYRQSRQPAWPFNGPPSVEHPQVAQPVRTAPVQIASAPVVSTERVQTTRGESRPNVSQNQSAPRNAASAAPAPARSQPQPSGNSGNNSGNFRGQGWVAQNH